MSGPERPEPHRPTRCWLSKSDQLFVSLCVLAVLVLAGGHALRLSRFGSRPIDVEHLPDERYAYLVDVNRSTWVEWVQFEGIGETLARRIVEERERNGPYQTIDDLLRVPGLGARRLARLRPNLRLTMAASPPADAQPRPRGAAAADLDDVHFEEAGEDFNPDQRPRGP